MVEKKEVDMVVWMAFPLVEKREFEMVVLMDI